MNKLPSLIVFLIFLSIKLHGQNLFSNKVEGCNLSEFCLDCGEPKANYDIASFNKLISSLNSKYNFKGAKGKSGFQILVDSLGKGVS